MSDIEILTERIKQFNKERDWDQFHNPKDLAIALNIETSELLELFLWKRNEDVNIDKVKEELADIFMYAFNIADKFELNVSDIVKDTSIAALKMAIIHRPLNNSSKLIFHSDRGIQYACTEFVNEVQKHTSITRSMSGRGNCYDNAVAESSEQFAKRMKKKKKKKKNRGLG